MRFNVRSLGGKLIISAALTLLLCMLLFAVTSWFFLKALYEHEAQSAATSHLALIQDTYRKQTAILAQELQHIVVQNPALLKTLAHPAASPSDERPEVILLSALAQDQLSMLMLVSPQKQIRATTDPQFRTLPSNLLPLFVAGLKWKNCYSNHSDACPSR